MTKEDYAAKIPDVAERENAARLFEAMCAAEEAAHQARYAGPAMSPETEAALRELRKTYNAKRDEIHSWFEAEQKRIAPEQQCPHEAAAEAAAAAYDAAPGEPIVDDGDEKALRCALSGVPIYETDTTVEIGGKVILASLLLSDEQIEALTADDEEEVFEDAA